MKKRHAVYQILKSKNDALKSTLQFLCIFSSTVNRSILLARSCVFYDRVVCLKDLLLTWENESVAIFITLYCIQLWMIYIHFLPNLITFFLVKIKFPFLIHRRHLSLYSPVAEAIFVTREKSLFPSRFVNVIKSINLLFNCCLCWLEVPSEKKEF